MRAGAGLMPNEVIGLVFLVASLSFLAGFYAERGRARLAVRAWRQQRGRRARTLPFKWSSKGRPAEPVRAAPVTDAFDQLRAVNAANFEKRPLMSKAEARVFYAAEEAILAQRLPWRVMAQVSLGEILSTSDKQAFSAINSKRVDILLISRQGEPIAAIEYQGEGHYQGAASARDASKREALRKAGVHFIEVTPTHGVEDLAHEIARIARNTKPPSHNIRPAPSRP